MSKKSSKLMEISEMFDKININFDELNSSGIDDIITIIKQQKDTRYQPNVKHKMEDIILITLFAVLAKCNEWTEIESFAQKKEKWLKKIFGITKWYTFTRYYTKGNFYFKSKHIIFFYD